MIFVDNKVGWRSLDHNSLATCKRKQVFGLKNSLKLEPSPLGRPCSSQNYDSTTHKLSRVGVEKKSEFRFNNTQNLIKKFICVLWKVISRIFGHSNFFKSDFLVIFFVSDSTTPAFGLIQSAMTAWIVLQLVVVAASLLYAPMN